MSSRRPTISGFEAELEMFASLDRPARMVVLAIIAHDLTVGIRSALLDLHASDALDRLQALNEYLHQITGRMQLSDERSGRGEGELLRDIAESDEMKGRKSAVVRRLGPALRYVSADHKPTAAIA